MRNSGGRRIGRVSGIAATTLIGPDGKVKGRTADGKSISLPVAVGGKSYAQRLMEAAAAKKTERRKRGT